MSPSMKPKILDTRPRKEEGTQEEDEEVEVRMEERKEEWKEEKEESKAGEVREEMEDLAVLEGKVGREERRGLSVGLQGTLDASTTCLLWHSRQAPSVLDWRNAHRRSSCRSWCLSAVGT